MNKSHHDSFSAVIDWLEFTVTGLQLESVIFEILKLVYKNGNRALWLSFTVEMGRGEPLHHVQCNG